MKLALGTVQLGLPYGINNQFGKPSKAESFAILDLALKEGINLLDTAEGYGDSIAVIGDYIKQNPAADFKIVSKFISNPYKSISNGLASSLDALQTKSIYAYLFHRIQDYKSGVFKSELLELRHAGKFTKLGVSLYDLGDLKMVLVDRDIELIQIPFNVFDNSEEKRQLLNQAKAEGKEIHVRSVFLQGLFHKNPNELKGKLEQLKSSLFGFQEMVTRFGLRIDSVCLNHALNQSFIDKVIIGVETKDQLQKNIDVTGQELPSLLFDLMEEINVDHKELLNPSNWDA